MANVDTRKRRANANQLAAGLTRGPVEVLDFFLPLWVGSQLGASAAAVGALIALETLVSLVIRPVAGALADRFDRARLAAARMRAEADEFFGTQDRAGDDDPWERDRA